MSVEIDYRSGHDEQPKNRMIDPYGMVYWNDKWYTVAYCHLKNGIRSFRVDRILSIKCTQNIFKRPENFSSREFFMKNLLPDLVGKEGLISLIIKGRPDALDELGLHWFLGHHLKERTSDQAIFLFEEKSIHNQVPYFLLSYGKSIQVIEPQSVREKLADIASELMEYYQL